jgi:uncharacterized protein (TIRG00374 family)
MKKFISPVIKISVTGGLFWLLFSRLGFRNIMDSVLGAHLGYFLAAVIVFFVSLVLSAVQWNLLLSHQGVRLGFRGAFNLYLVGHFFNNFLPGALGGDIVKIYRIREDVRRGKEALAATFADRYAGLFMLSLFALLSSFYLQFISRISIHGDLFLYTWILFAVFMASLFVFFSRRVGRFIYKVLLKYVNPFKMRDKIEELHSFLHLYRNERTLYMKIFCISAVTQLLRICVHILAARAVGFDVAAIYFLIFVPLIALLASLPVSFGGLGLREGLGKVLFGYVSPQAALAVATQFLASIVGILVSLVGGVIFVVEKKKRTE